MKSTLATAAIFARGNEDDDQKYEQVPEEESETEGMANFVRHGRESIAHIDQETHRMLNRHLRAFKSKQRQRLVVVCLGVLGIGVFLWWAISSNGERLARSCDTVEEGFTCQPNVSHTWGQYSPFFSVPSDIRPETPIGCTINFASILSRHGARDPTLGKSIKYAELVNRIHFKTVSYSKPFIFLKKYKYNLGADQLTTFGQQEMINSGRKFYERYKHLSRRRTPFIRASGQERVIQSAQNWTQGFHASKSYDGSADTDSNYPYDILTISEDASANNTLSHTTCAAFHTSKGYYAQRTFLSTFAPAITSRLNQGLKGMEFSADDAITLMDLCPFDTVASPLGHLSPFCSLFTQQDWENYDYYQSLGKYYGWSWGNELGATQGVGYTNELIARLTNSPVKDHTNTNTTLDSNPATFPLGEDETLFADFSHDNDMTSIFAALGLYNSTRPLLNSSLEKPEDMNGFAAAWTVPFAGRAYFERLVCVGSEVPWVRVLVNDRVVPLDWCAREEGDGLCEVGDFVEGLRFATEGGGWERCAVEEG